jgi:hypothetical protein
MSDKPKWPDEREAKPDEDGRGERPSDPNEFAKWLVDQATRDDDDQSG